MATETIKSVSRMLRLQYALHAAADAIKLMDCKIMLDNGISELERTEAIRALSGAAATLEVGNRGSRSTYDLPTRTLFPKADKHVGIRIGKFFHDHAELRMLGDVADMPWDIVSDALEAEEIPCPLALSKFHACYCERMAMLERAAAPTAPAPLSCA